MAVIAITTIILKFPINFLTCIIKLLKASAINSENINNYAEEHPLKTPECHPKRTIHEIDPDNIYYDCSDTENDEESLQKKIKVNDIESSSIVIIKAIEYWEINNRLHNRVIVIVHYSS